MDHLYDAPWWLYSVLIVVGLMLAWGGFSRRDRTLGVIGAVMLAAGVAVLGVSKLVETDREQVVRRSGELIKAVERKDWGAVGGYLDADATVSVPWRKNLCESRTQILEQAKQNTGMVGSLDLNITRVDIKDLVGQLQTTEPYVYINTDKGSQLTGWRFVWHKSADGKTWVVRAIDLIQVGLQPGGR